MRLELFSAEFVPDGPNATRHTKAVFHRRADDDLIAAMFSGPWCEFAPQVFSAAINDDGSAVTAFGAAAHAVDKRWRSLTEEDRWEQGWTGTACGAAIHAGAGQCRCIWVGDDQVFRVRGRKLIDSTGPHTVFHAQKRQGHRDANPNFKHVLTRWLSPEHSPDSVEWKLQAGDVVAVCSRFVDDSIIPRLSEEFSPQAMPKEIVTAAGRAEHRISHKRVCGFGQLICVERT